MLVRMMIRSCISAIANIDRRAVVDYYGSVEVGFVFARFGSFVRTHL